MERTIITLSNYNKIDFAEVQAIDVDIVRDLELILVNNAVVCNQIGMIVSNLAKKEKNGTFDYNKAVKGFYNIVVSYLNGYNDKIYDNYFYNKSMVSVHDRFIIANNLLIDSIDDIEEQSLYMTNTELKKYMNAYKKRLKEVFPHLKKDKYALHLELATELDALCKDNRISSEQSDNFIIN